MKPTYEDLLKQNEALRRQIQHLYLKPAFEEAGGLQGSYRRVSQDLLQRTQLNDILELEVLTPDGLASRMELKELISELAANDASFARHVSAGASLQKGNHHVELSPKEQLDQMRQQAHRRVAPNRHY